MMDEGESFVISDEDEYDFSPTVKKRDKASKQPTVIADSDEEEIALSDDEEVDTGRLTPDIHKAIRRSILNISRQVPSDDEEEEQNEEDEDEEESGEISNRFDVLDSEEEVRESRRSNITKIINDLHESKDESPHFSHKKRINRIIDSSDSDSADESPQDRKKSRKSLNDSRNNNKLNKSLSRDGSFDMLEETTSEFEASMDKPAEGTKFRNFDDILDDTSGEEEEESKEPSKKMSIVPRKSPKAPNNTLPEESINISDSPSDDLEELRPKKKANGVMCLDSPKKKANDSSRKISIGPRKSPKVQNQSIAEESINISDSPLGESSDDVEEVRPKKKANEVISLDSDTPSEVSNGDTTAMILAQEELGLTKVDPLLAQKRAMLVIEKQKVEQDLVKINLFLKEGQPHLLPDGGRKLQDSKRSSEAKLQEIRAQLDECRLVEPDSSDMSVESVSPIHSPLHSPVRLPNGADWRPRGAEAHRFDDNPMPLKNPFPNFDARNLGEKALETLHNQQALTLDTLKTFHGSLESRPTPDTQADDPKGLKINLMAHQKHALAWLLWREHQKPPGGVLADDMGLGKTLTMISLVIKAMEREDSGGESDDEWKHTKNRTSKVLGGTLVVCPASLLGQWEEEVKRRCRRGLLNVEVYHGNKRENVAKRLARNDMVITTYNIVSRENRSNGVLFKIQWKRIILDEGHVIRNHKSQLSEGVCGLSGFKRWVLTGTPIHNKEMDLFAILKFLQCSPFNDIRVWKRWVDNKNQAGLERLATVMKTLMLRRTKQELMNSGAVENLPEKFFELTWVDLDPEERLVYDKVMLHSKTIFAQFLEQRATKEQMFNIGAGNYVSNSKNPFNKAQKKLLAHHADDVKASQILVLLLRLRQICCHPTLINSMLDRADIELGGVEGMDNTNVLANKLNKMDLHTSLNESNEDEEGPALVSERVTEDLLTAKNPVFNRSRVSSKLKAVLDLIEKVLDTNDKIIIVSQWTGVLDIIADNLKKKRREYTALTGAVQVKDRGGIVDRFNYDETPQIMLLSLTAGGVGLNLVGANHLILVDVHWNPQLESQAQDRIYRFGQTKNVYVYKFLCKDTIEERIKNLQDKKLELANSVLSGTGKAMSAKLTLDDLKSLFGM